MMKKILQVLNLVCLLFCATACNTYYVASANQPISIYADRNITQVAYDVPAGTVLLLKGYARKGLTRVRYHSNLTWYWVDNTNLTLVPGFNPKQYDQLYSSYETTGTATTSNGYDATIQTGPRGGKYYINKNGNKTYIKKGTSSGGTRHVGGSRGHH
ncbi:hypothetical protein [Mucilaginibacter sp. 22184]|uniref:hypothetical protein n=1 Tax=Mucilaginibacter sp. 22184 TaxID=3453887 RepID=UPI003F834039